MLFGFDVQIINNQSARLDSYTTKCLVFDDGLTLIFASCVNELMVAGVILS